MLGEGDTDTEEEIELHSEDDTEGDRVSLAVGVCETVPQGDADKQKVGVCEIELLDDADRQRVPLGDELLIDVELMLGVVEIEAEEDTELRPEGDVKGDCVSLAVGVCETVPQEVAD